MKDYAICENSWNMEKIKFNLIVSDHADRNVRYSVIGNCKELGLWKKPLTLERAPLDEEVL